MTSRVIRSNWYFSSFSICAGSLLISAGRAPIWSVCDRCNTNIPISVLLLFETDIYLIFHWLGILSTEYSGCYVRSVDE